MSLLAQQRAKLLEKQKQIAGQKTQPPETTQVTSAQAATTAPASSSLLKARSSLLAKQVTAKPAATAQAPAQATGKAGDTVALDSAVARTKTLMQTAEEQLATDKANGLFDLKQAVNSDIPADKFMEAFQQLRFAQLAKTPELPQLQVMTMKNLQQYEELAHILTDEQIAVIVSGALEVANIKMVTGKSKPNNAKTVTAKANSLSLDDFG